MINNVHRYHFVSLHADKEFKTPIKRIYFSGHSQGGGIETLLTVLWQSRVKCDFFIYFWSKASKHLKQLMDNAKVVTFGAVGIFGHGNNGQNMIDYLYHDKILNTINAQDPVPMLFMGIQPKPTSELQENGESLIDWVQLALHDMAQALMDEFDEKAYYGPAGKYMVILEKKRLWWVKDVLFKKFDKNVDAMLWHKHLVHGAHTLRSTNMNAIKSLFKTLFEHHPEEYRKPIVKGCKKYGDKLKKGQSGFWIVVYIIELVLFLAVCCGVVAIYMGNLVWRICEYSQPKRRQNEIV